MYKIITKGIATNGIVNWSFYKEFGQDYATKDIEKASSKYTALLDNYGRNNLKLIDEVDMDILVNAMVDCDCSKDIDLNEMIANAAEGSTIVLSSDVSTKEVITFDKDITINGNGYKIIYKGTQLTDGAMIVSDDYNVTLTNLIIDGNNKARAIMTKGGKLTLNDVSITNNTVVASQTAGVVATGNAELVLNDCTITDNTAAYTDAKDKYAADLWVGSNANATINGGAYNNIFVNANAASANDKGGLTVVSGTVDNLWLEYSNGYGADLSITGGDIDKLYIANTNGSNEAMMVLNNPANGKYEGGTGIVNNTTNTPENSKEPETERHPDNSELTGPPDLQTEE